MARKDTLNYPIPEFSASNLSADVDNFLNPTEVNLMDNVGVTLGWTGTPVGTFEVYVSNSPKPKNQLVAADFTQLDFGTPITIDNTESQHLISINQIPFKWIAYKYVFSSGNGGMSVIMNNKQVGG